MSAPAGRAGSADAGSVAARIRAVLGVLGTLLVLVLLGGWLWRGSPSLRWTAWVLLLPPQVLAAGVEVLVWRGRSVAVRAAAWTLFGVAVLAMAPLVLYALYGVFFNPGDDTGRNWSFVGSVCAVAALSLGYAALLGARLAGRGRRRSATAVRLAVHALVTGLLVAFLVTA